MEHEIILNTDLEELPPESKAVIGYIKTALQEEGVTIGCEVDVLFTDDEGIHQINLEQRGVDRPTDVLSFPMFEFVPGEPPTEADTDLVEPATGLLPLGDMVLNLDRVKAQAQEFGHSNERELAYLTVHSVLHLLGYDHVDEGEMQKQMRGREESILGTMGITRG